MIRGRNFILLLAAGDILALLLFVLVGQVDHETVNAAMPLGGVLYGALPFVSVWLVSAFLLGAYREDALNPRAMFTRTLTACLVALPLGVVLRALLLGRAVIPVAFILAGLGFATLFLLAWRMVFVLIVQRRKRANSKLVGS